MKGSLGRGSYYSLREIHDCMLAQDRFKVVIILKIVNVISVAQVLI